jgi:hypothetical protein
MIEPFVAYFLQNESLELVHKAREQFRAVVLDAVHQRRRLFGEEPATLQAEVACRS